MRKKKKIDFIIEEREDSKVIFRFYPRRSSCHGFNENSPKTWADVYKVYYYYKILHVYKDHDNVIKHRVLFDSLCDECSIIDEIAARCKYLAEGKKKVTVTRQNPFDNKEETYTVRLLNKDIFPCGMGVWWRIRESLDKKDYIFELFNWHETGYWFWLPKNKVGEFGEYLNECCEYMLANGDPI